MKYLLLMYGDAATGDEPAERETALREVVESGEWLDGAPLADPALTCTVRVRDGVAGRTTGPYQADGRGSGAHIARYWVVDCEDLDRAAELAAGLPEARAAAVEIRQLMAPSGMEM